MKDQKIEKFPYFFIEMLNDEAMSLEDRVLWVVESYGDNVDSHGWEIPERFEAVREIIEIFRNYRPQV